MHMRAGFASKIITPAVGCPMQRFINIGASVAIHDDLFARALYLSHEGRASLISRH